MDAHHRTVPPATASQVTLLVPGLFSGGAIPKPLTRLLARADRLAGGGDLSERQFALLGIAREPGCDLPLAAVTRVTDMGVIDRDWWIRADPVYLEPRRDGLVLHAGIGLRRDEAERLATELNESLALDGWLLKAPSPERWYLKPPSGTAVTTTPLDETVGRNIHPLLPRGPDHPAWHSRLNELQILLHTSPVNAEREARGALPANSVWFWGGGRLPRVAPTGWTAVFAQDPLSLGLARLAGVPAHSLPTGGVPLLREMSAGATLVVLESLRAAPAEGLDRFCDRWLVPLTAAIQLGAIAALTLVSDQGPMFRYRRWHRWRLWRRGHTLTGWLEQAA